MAYLEKYVVQRNTTGFSTPVHAVFDDTRQALILKTNSCHEAEKNPNHICTKQQFYSNDMQFHSRLNTKK